MTDVVQIDRRTLLELADLLSKNVCNAGGYDKSMLRACALISDFHGKEQIKGFEAALGLLLPKIMAAIGYPEASSRDPYRMVCRCNGRCNEVHAEISGGAPVSLAEITLQDCINPPVGE